MIAKSIIYNLRIMPSRMFKGGLLHNHPRLICQLSIRLSHNASATITPFTFVQRRLFSDKINSAPEEMIVNYEQVQKYTNNKNALIIDVREPDEIKEFGKIPNSINIPLDNVTQALGSLPDKEFEKLYNRQKPKEDTQIIFYCMIGKRSGMAQQNALNMGFKHAKNYLGSWNDWASNQH